MILANAMNGLAFPHDDTCYFQSQHGHQCAIGYFAHTAVSMRTLLALLRGEPMTIVDATRRHKLLTDAQKFGVPTFCLVFNRAIGRRDVVVCGWQTPEMVRVAHAQVHKPLVQTIRKLMRVYGARGPLRIGAELTLVCHQGATWDDRPARLREVLTRHSMLPEVVR